MGGVLKRSDESRGQSEVLGAILLFGILILGIALIQLYVVPQHVADTEQGHVEQIENDFTGLYASLTDAAGSNGDRTATITLGTRYQSFPTFILPPPAGGTLKSEEVGTLSADGGDEFQDANLLEDTCGLSTVETKSLHYEAKYNEFRNAGEYTYETGLKYKRVNRRTLQPDQRLIEQNEAETGTTINLVPITHGSVYESGTSARSLTFEPGVTGDTGTFELDNGDSVNISVPMQYADAWQDSFDEVDANVDINYNSGRATLILNEPNYDYRIRCTPIGINSPPNNSPRFLGEDDDGDSGAINPVGEGELVLVDSSSDELTFKNFADTQKTVTDVRIPWILNPGNVKSPWNLTFTQTGASENVSVPDSQWSHVGTWTWQPEGDPDDELDVEVGNNQGNDPNTGYAIVFKFNDGTSSTYLISGGSGGGPP